MFRLFSARAAFPAEAAAKVQAQIEHERMIEFPLENLRWYDLLHSGHVEFFQQASRYGDLYVSLESEKCINHIKLYKD